MLATQKLMNIRDRIEIEQHMLRRPLILPTPPACSKLLEHARSAGLKIGTVFILSHRLNPGSFGGYERASGDIWCHYGAAKVEGDRLLLQSLLWILAHMKCDLSAPTTIEEDWQQDREAWQMAFQLAMKWNMPELLLQQELDERLAESEQLHDWYEEAGNLAGCLRPAIARAAYQALVDIRRQQGWDEKQFEAALGGYSEHPEDNAAVLAFDRTVLRSSWGQPHRVDRQGPPFGDLTLVQQSQQIAYLLRTALAAWANRHTNLVPLRKIERGWGDEPLHLFFLVIDSDLEFPSLIAHCNTWLVDESPDLAAVVTWHVYGSGTIDGMRIYRLCVRYKPSLFDPPVSTPSARELWVLFPADADERRRWTEAAFQRYILCWPFMQEIHCESLEDGLPILWNWLNQGES